MRYAWWNTIICIFCQIINIQCVILVIVLSNLIRFFAKKSFYHQGFFAVKRRVVFILGAKWVALVRGWRRDCVVGGMETRFQ